MKTIEYFLSPEALALRIAEIKARFHAPRPKPSDKPSPILPLDTIEKDNEWDLLP